MKIDFHELSLLLVFLTQVTCPKMSSNKLVSVDFEVYGKVQGVFFRKYTQKEASKLGLKGWCMNTSRSTVQGNVQGEHDKIELMKNWLRNVGSPSSRIDKAEFKNEKSIHSFTFGNFDIRH